MDLARRTASCMAHLVAGFRVGATFKESTHDVDPPQHRRNVERGVAPLRNEPLALSASKVTSIFPD